MDKAANNLNWWNRAAKIKKMILSGWTIRIIGILFLIALYPFVI
jgi:hypothetical protein